jgi:hypothetical protein
MAPARVLVPCLCLCLYLWKVCGGGDDYDEDEEEEVKGQSQRWPRQRPCHLHHDLRAEYSPAKATQDAVLGVDDYNVGKRVLSKLVATLHPSQL